MEKEKFTKYEKARMIGARALQISMGAPFLVKVDEKKLKEIKYNPVEIAKLEFEAGVIPLKVIRRIPEFEEDKGRHPVATKEAGAAESVGEEVATEMKLEEEDEAEEEEEARESVE